MNIVFESIQENIKAGNLLIARGQIENFIRNEPNNYLAREMSAYLWLMQNNRNKAIAELRDLVKLPYCSPRSLYELGSLLIGEGNWLEALDALERAHGADPNSFEILHDLATTYAALGRRQEALVIFQRALEINQGSSELFFNLGRLCDDLNLLRKSIGFYKEALKIQPNYLEVLINIGINLMILGEEIEALNYFDKAFELNPSFPYLYGDRIFLKQKICNWENSTNDIESLVTLIAGGKRAITPFHFLSLIDNPKLSKEVASIYAADYYPLNTILGDIPKRLNGKKIKIGYFSPDFRNHATSILIAELFELHDREVFEVIGFSVSRNKDDSMKLRLINAFDQFIECADLNDLEVASLSRKMEIDIAVDLGGVTQDARMGIFAARAAPIQVNYLVYPGTLGTSYHDYLIADRYVILDGEEVFYTEKIVYLPASYQLNDRKRVISNKVFTRSNEGLPDEAFVFCCFNNSYKITKEIFSIWMEILIGVPDSVLWLIESGEGVRENLWQEARNHGVSSDRIVFAKKVNKEDHLARHALADLFLDTYPYGAHTTASDALWAGLPLLTIAGKSFQARVASSLLINAGCPGLIAKNHVEYKLLAIELSRNPLELNKIRSFLKINRNDLVVFNTPKNVRSIEAAYKEMALIHQEGSSPRSFCVC